MVSSTLSNDNKMIPRADLPHELNYLTLLALRVLEAGCIRQARRRGIIVKIKYRGCLAMV